MTDTNTLTKGTLALPSALYDVAKDATTVWLPAAATLYITLAAIFGWPGAQEVSATVVAVVTFLGIVLKISTSSYSGSDKAVDGTLHVDQSGPTDKYVFDVSTDLDEVAQQKTITLRVNPTTGVAQPVDTPPQN